MCGITGLYSFEPRTNRQELHRIGKAMTDSLIHRGPDSGDIWQDPDVPFVIGHRRLSILDLSECGAQPMESASGRYMIAFNGEIYNFKEIRAEIKKNYNHNFKGHSDTEVILAGFEYWGFEDTIEKLNGMFAIALWDRKAKALFLARDRFGKKPLYVGWAGSTLVFGSETKALAAQPDFRRDVNRDALTSYMRFGYVPAPFCIYDQVWQLPAGHMMALDTYLLRGGQDLKPLMSCYWSHKDALEEARENPIENLETIVDEFEEILSSCVSERMISDVPLGAFLSGGIDSSSVVAMMQKHSDKPVKTYTIGFNEEGFNEAEYAKQIAEHLGTEHYELYLDPKKALDIVPKMATMYDEPFADVSSLPTYLVSEFARQDVTVVLSGDGGDEMLGGYARHVTGPKAWNAVNNIPAPLRGPLSQMIKTISPTMWSKLRGGKPQFGTHVHKFAEILPPVWRAQAWLHSIMHPSKHHLASWASASWAVCWP